MPRLLTGLLLFGFLLATQANTVLAQTETKPHFWSVQSIDTMKFSRDAAREMKDIPKFNSIIDVQVSKIADTGATHVAIATPYDEEFLPFLTRWVKSARKHNLKVWFRGNWSGWEGWFNYGRINRSQHLELTKNFIHNHYNLFEDGDIFSACPECENGGPGDPRNTGDVAGYRQFLTDLYVVTKTAFKDIKKDVGSNYFSMNGDVARLIMDRQTTSALGGLVVIDHYVKTPQQLAADIKAIAEQSGGQIVLGEMGVPIPDIHGYMAPNQQADWLETVFKLLVPMTELQGVNYWVGFGGSTKLWTDTYAQQPAVDILTQYFSPLTFTLLVTDELNQPIPLAQANYLGRIYTADRAGRISLPLYPGQNTFDLTSSGYSTGQFQIDTINTTRYVLRPTAPSSLFQIKRWAYYLFLRLGII